MDDLERMFEFGALMETAGRIHSEGLPARPACPERHLSCAWAREPVMRNMESRWVTAPPER